MNFSEILVCQIGLIILLVNLLVVSVRSILIVPCETLFRLTAFLSATTYKKNKCNVTNHLLSLRILFFYCSHGNAFHPSYFYCLAWDEEMITKISIYKSLIDREADSL